MFPVNKYPESRNCLRRLLKRSSSKPSSKPKRQEPDRKRGLRNFWKRFQQPKPKPPSPKPFTNLKDEISTLDTLEKVKKIIESGPPPKHEGTSKELGLYPKTTVDYSAFQ